MATHQLPIATSFTQSEDITASQHHGATSIQYAQANTPHHFTTHGDATGVPHSALVLSTLSSQPGISSVVATQSLEGVGTSATVSGVGGGAGNIVTPSGGETDLHQVLSGLQQSGELSSVLQHQPHLVEGKHQCVFVRATGCMELCVV